MIIDNETKFHQYDYDAHCLLLTCSVHERAVTVMLKGVEEKSVVKVATIMKLRIDSHSLCVSHELHEQTEPYLKFLWTQFLRATDQKQGSRK